MLVMIFIFLFNEPDFDDKISKSKVDESFGTYMRRSCAYLTILFRNERELSRDLGTKKHLSNEYLSKYEKFCTDKITKYPVLIRDPLKDNF